MMTTSLDFLANFSAIGLGFLEGLSLIASPCILPILPIVLGSSLNEGPGRPYGIISGFIAAFASLVLLSRFLVNTFQIDPTLLRTVAFFILLLMGISLLSERLSGFFASFTAGLSQWGHRLQRGIHIQNGFASGVFIGLCIGAVWVPCSGPILAAVLVQSIQQKTNLSSILILIAFSLGAGLPMLAIAIGGQRIMTQLNWFKAYGAWIRKGAGAIIILTVLFSAQDLWEIPSLNLPLSLGNGSAYAAAPAIQLENGLAKPYPAPTITGIQQWLNSPPLKLSELKGKVVLIDFWTYSCINCIRTLPHITQWDAKYRKAGLVIIGVHAPEFEFERKAENVIKALKKYQIQYPVALDNNLETWSQFNNHYWPAHYLINRSGQVVYTHFGEGQYEVTEKNIQRLLGTTGAIRQSKAPPVHFQQTAETYLGTARADRYQHYSATAALPLHHWSLSGEWSKTSEYILATKPNASLHLHFFAKKVFLVLGTKTGEPIPVQAYLGGKPFGKSFWVKGHRLYTILSLPSAQKGQLVLKSLKPGLQAYAFTFES